jgi:hypothetical protein
MVSRPDSLSHLRFRLPVVEAVAVAAAVVAALPLLLPLRVARLQRVREEHAVAQLPRLSNREPGKFINVQCSILIRVG